MSSTWTRRRCRLAARLVTVVEKSTEGQRIAYLVRTSTSTAAVISPLAPPSSRRGRGTDAARIACDRRRRGADILRIGAPRGHLRGDIGPFYRRTYTVMGDVVNLAARLMGKAQRGRIYATPTCSSVEHRLPHHRARPFMVKARRGRSWHGTSARRRIAHAPWHAAGAAAIGREGEITTLREALAARDPAAVRRSS